MKKRAWQYAGLAAGGGILLQAAGCAEVFVQTMLNTALQTALNLLLAQVGGGTATTG